MKNNRSTLKSLLFCVSAWAVSGCILSGCAEKTLNAGEWSLAYDTEANGIDITKGSKLVYDNLYASYKLRTVSFPLVIIKNIPFPPRKSKMLLVKAISIR